MAQPGCAHGRDGDDGQHRHGESQPPPAPPSIARVARRLHRRRFEPHSRRVGANLRQDGSPAGDRRQRRWGTYGVPPGAIEQYALVRLRRGLDFLVVGVVLLGVSGLAAVKGKAKLAQVSPMPEQTVETVRQDVETAKESLQRGASGPTYPDPWRRN
jgi:hypothetical protein